MDPTDRLTVMWIDLGLALVWSLCYFLNVFGLEKRKGK
jgi:hypothetical protein